MKKILLLCLTVAFISLSFVISPSVDAKNSTCPTLSSDLKAYSKCQISIDKLHPTQPFVGNYEVKYKDAFLKAIEHGESTKYKTVKEYVDRQIVPVVLGPGNRFYMIDSHHTMKAIWDYYKGKSKNHDDPQNSVKIEIHRDWRNKPDFWSTMEKNHYTYLGHPGSTISPKDLPRNLGELKNDPYRAAVGMALKWGFLKRPKGDNKFFYQFKLADCLKEFGLTLPEEINRSHVYQTLAMINDPKYENSPKHKKKSTCKNLQPRKLSLEKIAAKLP